MKACQSTPLLHSLPQLATPQSSKLTDDSVFRRCTRGRGYVTSLTVAETLGGLAALRVCSRVCSFCWVLLVYVRFSTVTDSRGFRTNHFPQRCLRSTYYSFIPKLEFKIEERKNACQIISTRERGERERERESLTSCPPVVVFLPFMHVCISCQSVLRASKSLLAFDALDTKRWILRTPQEGQRNNHCGVLINGISWFPALQIV